MLSGWASAAATSPAATCGTTPSVKKFRCLLVRCSTSLASLAVSLANTSVRLRPSTDASASASGPASASASGALGLETAASSSLPLLPAGSVAHESRSPPPNAVNAVRAVKRKPLRITRGRERVV